MISAQFARPRGLLGRLVGRTMARQNAQLTLRVVAALNLRGDETVIEFGPGPGVGLRLLAQALPIGRVIGVEPSPVMRAQAAARTRQFANRVELIDATAETTPLAAGSIDAVCAVNNVQLWQPLPASLARVLQLLRQRSSWPGWRLLACVSRLFTDWALFYLSTEGGLPGLAATMVA